MIVQKVLSLQITIFLLVAAGFFARKKGMVGAQGQKNINDLVINVILPCNIVKAFLSADTGGKLSAYAAVLLISLGIQLLCLVYGKLAFRRQPQGRKNCLIYGTVCSNAGFLGNPIAEGLYGAQGLVYASFYLIPLRVMMWSAGLPLFSGSSDWRSTVKRVLTHPCIIACEIGIVFMLTGWTLPQGLYGAVSALGSCNTAMSMMVIGMILAQINLKEILDRTALAYSLHRLVIIPALVWLLCSPLPIGRDVVGLCVILAAMPAGATTSILAGKYDMEPEFATKLVVTSTLLSMPTLCLWSMILG